MSGLHRQKMAMKAESAGEERVGFVRDTKGRLCQPSCLGLEGTTSRRTETNNSAPLRRWLDAQRAKPAPLLKPKMVQEQCELPCCHIKHLPLGVNRLRGI